MSVLAELLRRRGCSVTGSDTNESAVVGHLRSLGIPVHVGPHRAESLGGADVVVTTAAVTGANPELTAARTQGIPVVRRADLLARVVSEGRSICVAGAHGKTTTTAMCGAILAEAGLDPTVLVGGAPVGGTSGLRHGGSSWFVTEADEFDRAFLSLTPTIALITNVDREHLDTYGTEDAIADAFLAFAGAIPDDGVCVAGIDDPRSAAVAARLRGRRLTFGTSVDANVRARGVQLNLGGSRFDVVWADQVTPVALRVPGLHNVRNALAAFAAGVAAGVEAATAARGLASFKGMSRRCEVVAERGGVTFVDDYAHHPTEVAATIAALQAGRPGRRIVVLFQPHLFTRTRDQAGGFAQALSAADVVILAPVYASREEPIANVTSALIQRAASPADARRMTVLASEGEVGAAVRSTLRSGDVFVTMGAGDVRKFAAPALAHFAATADRIGSGDST